MRRTFVFLTTAVLAALLLSQSPDAQAQDKPAAPPSNPFLAQSNNSIAHANAAQTDSTVDPGPVGPTRTLGADEVRYHDLGMFNLPYLISGPYKDGKRVVWTNGTQFLTKLDYDSFDIIAKLRLPGDDHADTLTHENFIKALDADVPFEEKFETAKKSGDPALYGIYTLLDKDNQYVVAGQGFVRVYGDATEGDRNSGIVVKANWDQPKEIPGTFIGMNMTFDGRIVLATTQGYIIALSRDFKDMKTVRLSNAEAELDKQPKGVEWIRNSFSIDEKGGIYVPSQSHLHKVIWTGDKLSVDEKDGAWHEPYRNSLGRGTGATPTLVGFGDEPDKLVVLTDGDTLMNVTVYWRDEIPADWKQLDGAPSRRIAGLQPATFGDPNPRLRNRSSRWFVPATACSW